MIDLRTNPKQEIVKVGHGKEVRALNSRILCPFCPNGEVWTWILSCSKHSPVKRYVTDPHFCTQCQRHFVLHEVVVAKSEEEQEKRDNAARAKVLGKDYQHVIPFSSPIETRGVEYG
jgi:hypothetical protein